jgi:DNA processing protein
MIEDDLPWLIALTQVPHIGPVHARVLLQHAGSARAVFRSPRRVLETIPGIGKVRADAIRGWKDMHMAEREARFMQQYHIRAISFRDPDYPQRLSHAYDAPVLLYYRGTASLNHQRVISIIGTRTPSEYGKDRARDLLQQLATYQPLVISGLAYGIDTLAHRHALRQGLPTVGVLAHGLDRIYPNDNKSLAREMLEHGGLLTDFPSGTNPDAVNFPRRNRIVAGLADAVVVVETGEKGGSMITARMANGYDREVFAFPGRTTDAKSAGCHTLIRENRAQLFTGAEHIATAMNWHADVKDRSPVQTAFRLPLPATEQAVLDLVLHREQPSFDEISRQLGLDAGETASILLSLEMQQYILPLPGKRYRPVT